MSRRILSLALLAAVALPLVVGAGMVVFKVELAENMIPDQAVIATKTPDQITAPVKNDISTATLAENVSFDLRTASADMKTYGTPLATTGYTGDSGDVASVIACKDRSIVFAISTRVDDLVQPLAFERLIC